MSRFARLALAIPLVVVGACGERPDDLVPSTMSLSDVASGCNDGDPSRPGAVEVIGELRDANTTVTLEDCSIRLVDGADVMLNNVVVEGGILNLHDRNAPLSTNTVRLQATQVTSAALLIELNDETDEVSMAATDVEVESGFSVKVAESDDEANAGGSVRFVTSSVRATGPDAPVIVVASEHSGTVELVDTTLDTRGLLLVTAAACGSVLEGDRLDCSTATLARRASGS